MTRQRFHSPLVAVFLAVASLFGIPAAQAEEDGRILWIGNSLVYYNDLPKMVAECHRTSIASLGAGSNNGSRV